MKTTKITCFLLLALFSFIQTKAQKLNGFSIESKRTEIVVLLNGQQMCEGTTSCFIANLQPGTYKLQVFRADEMDLHATNRDLLYYDKIKYDGFGVRHIKVVNNDDDYHMDYERYGSRDLMSERAFRDFIHSLKEVHFDDEREKIIDLLPSYTQFTTRQCKEIIELFSFDNKKADMLIKLYPRVIDKETFHIAIDALSFTSNKDRVIDYVKRYNHNGRRH